ncbi:hypothetical protein RSC2_01244 [Bacillus paralicheniformis]|nr:hypothetical protein LI7559_10065 [Bacillus licheniformis LMG 7559]BCE07639.1 hypothetical protein RSC1_03796 [Bacillus paralicheniformis]BCE09448.1 hypothetical protein RSC2_01244 [Bacillus paralicheniformis]BCE15603.1 hypothetical protein RSC3_02959 [Bacillus paralicheniformis]
MLRNPVKNERKEGEAKMKWRRMNFLLKWIVKTKQSKYT